MDCRLDFMRLHQWQQRPDLMKAARELLDKNETFGQIMDLVREESPANLPTCIASTESEHSRRLGYIEGYHYALRILDAAWTKPVKMKEVEARFEPPKE